MFAQYDPYRELHMSGAALREYMQYLGVDEEELSSRFNRSRRTISRWLNSDKIYPPAAAAINAWVRLKKYGENWRT